MGVELGKVHLVLPCGEKFVSRAEDSETPLKRQNGRHQEEDAISQVRDGFAVRHHCQV